MSSHRYIMITPAIILLLSTLAIAQHEKHIKRRDLPPAVAKTVQDQSRGATIRGFSEEHENGKTFYEVELTVNGHSKDVLMDADGVVVEVEEQTRLEDLLPAVREGLSAKAMDRKLLENREFKQARQNRRL